MAARGTGKETTDAPRRARPKVPPREAGAIVETRGNSTNPFGEMGSARICSVSLFRKAREGWNNALVEAPWRTLRRRR